MPRGQQHAEGQPAPRGAAGGQRVPTPVTAAVEPRAVARTAMASQVVVVGGAAPRRHRFRNAAGLPSGGLYARWRCFSSFGSTQRSEWGEMRRRAQVRSPTRAHQARAAAFRDMASGAHGNGLGEQNARAAIEYVKPECPAHWPAMRSMAASAASAAVAAGNGLRRTRGPTRGAQTLARRAGPGGSRQGPRRSHASSASRARAGSPRRARDGGGLRPARTAATTCRCWSASFAGG